MKRPVFTGSSVAIVTPFKDGAVDYEKMAQLIDFHAANNTSAITVCGTTGESPALSADEHKKLTEFCVRRAAGRMKVISGTGSNNTETALALSKDAEQAGADALLIVTPYYNKTTQRGLIKHYTYIADRVSLPIIIYNVPSRTGVSFAADTYAELSKHQNINGVKEAANNIPLFISTLSKCPDDFYVWSGNDDDIVPMMSMGAKGVISVAANIVPDVIAQITEFCLKGDFPAAAELQKKYYALINALFIEVNPIPIKAAMNYAGFDVGDPRLPLCDMAPGNFKILKAEMERLGISENKYR